MKKEKFSKTNQSEHMSGVINAYCSAIKENVSEIEAIQEFIDNAFDANATEINITIGDKEFTCTDNGDGFDDKRMKEYVENFSCPNEDVKNGEDKTTIGLRGVGSKNAIISLADFGKLGDSPVANAVITTSDDGININSAVFTLSDNEDLFVTPHASYNVKDTSRGKGTTVSIRPIRKINSALPRTINYISSVYPCLMAKRNTNVTINGKQIETKDMMYLSVLGDKINEIGVHIIDGLVFVVKEYTLVSNKNKKLEKTVKVVYLVVSKCKNEEKLGAFEDDKPFKYGGTYTMYHDRYLNLHVKSEEMGSNFPQRGGTGRVRGLIILDNNEDLFYVRGNKSSGIRELSKNQNLEEYTVKGYSNDKTFYDVFTEGMKHIYEVMEFESFSIKDENGDKVELKTPRVITEKVVRDMFSGIPKRKLAKEYDFPTANKIAKKTTPAISPIINQVTDVEKVFEILTAKEDDDTLEDKSNNTSLEVKTEEVVKVIEVRKNIETGATEYSFCDNIPNDTNKQLIDILFKSLCKAKVPMSKIGLVCAYVNSALHEE